VSKGGVGSKFLHLVRYGTAADQKYLLRSFLGTYDQVVINANMVAHMRGALTAFLLQHARKKPYFIDPQTHAFQHDVANLESRGEKSAGKIKRSVQTLLDEYGEPVKSIVGEKRESVVPGDFADKAVLEGFCRRVLEFQRNAITQEAEESDTAKYYKFLEDKGKLKLARFAPTLVVAPYFYMTNRTFQAWANVNIWSACYALDKCVDENVAVQVVISKDLLQSDTGRKRLINTYTAIKPAMYLLWVDSFSEHDAAEDDLYAFVDLVTQLSSKAPVVNLYGGFFSVALRRCHVIPGLMGVCHGLEYGESRPVVPVGGGIPMAKFYYPTMHKRIPFREALRVVRKHGGMRSPADFHEKVCGCRECRAVIETDPDIDFAEYGKTRPVSFMRRGQPIAIDYPLPETKEHCVAHYMWCKQREYAASLSADQIMKDLSQTRKLAGTLDLESVAYAALWQKLLKKASQAT